MRRAVEPRREGCEDAGHPPGYGGVIGVGQVEAGDLVKQGGKMAEHMAGTTMVVMRVLAATIGAAPGTMVILAKRRDVMAMLRLACGCLPSKTGRKQGRQEDGEQCRSDVFRRATHR